ncbi:helix-turn-helix transcriptional regulator [bacterium]|nr:helix-turn-helix transcriptional regulator [bacterium]
MNLNSIVSALTKKQQNETKSNSTHSIGAIARMRRLELNMTLEQVSNRICSVSYLSKVESNKIVPNPVCMALLMEKMRMPKYEQYLLENENELLSESLNYFYCLDRSSYRMLFEKVEDIKNAIASIIKIGYYILIKEYDEIETLINETKKLVGSLSSFSLEVFSLYSALYSIEKCEFENANNILERLIDQKGDATFMILVKEAIFKSHIKESRYIYAEKEYEELIHIYSANEHFERIREIKILYMEALYDAREYKTLTLIGSGPFFTTYYLENDKFNYLMGKSYIKINHTIAAKEYLDRIDKNSEYFKKCLDEKLIVSYEENILIQEVEALNKEKENFYYEYFLLKQADSPNLKDLFTKDIFAEEIKKSTIREKIDLYRLQAKALKESFRYKEATAVLEKIDELLDSFKNYR